MSNNGKRGRNDGRNTPEPYRLFEGGGRSSYPNPQGLRELEDPNIRRHRSPSPRGYSFLRRRRSPELSGSPWRMRSRSPRYRYRSRSPPPRRRSPQPSSTGYPRFPPPPRLEYSEPGLQGHRRTSPPPDRKRMRFDQSEYPPYQRDTSHGFSYRHPSPTREGISNYPGATEVLGSRRRPMDAGADPRASLKSKTESRTPDEEEEDLDELGTDGQTLNSNTRVIGGAKVRFLDGAEVGSVELSSCYSTVQLSNLPSRCSPETILSLLRSCGIQVKQSAVSMKSATVAEVQHEQYDFLPTLKEVLGEDTRIRVRSMETPVAAPTTTAARRPWARTVTCTWPRPSVIARLRYVSGPGAAARVTRALATGTIKGRTPKARLIQQDTVVLTGLDPSTSETDVREALGAAAAPDSLDIRRSANEKALWELQGEVVWAAMTGIYAMESWDVFCESYSPVVTSFGKYSCPEDARRVACGIDGIPVPELDGVSLSADVAGFVDVNLPAQVYAIHAHEIDAFRRKVETDSTKGVKLNAATDEQLETTCLRISGDDAKVVAAERRRLLSLVAGTMATRRDGETILWHDFFSRPEAPASLKMVADSNETYIHRDMASRSLIIHGTYEATTKTMAALWRMLEEIQIVTILMTLDQLAWLANGGLARLQCLLGAKNLDFGNSPGQPPPLLNVRGIWPDIQLAASLVRSMPANDEADGPKSAIGTVAEKRQDCVTCWAEGAGEIRTACNHFFCKECFANMCSSAVDTGRLPITCVGGSGSCAHRITLKEISAVLPRAEFEKLLRSSLDKHIRKNPGTFQHCPTPDCFQIYKLSRVATSTLFKCPACSVTLCTDCRTPHEGLTCADSKDLKAGGEKAFKRWKKSNKNLKDCPKCSIPIEKTGGCNHVKCSACETHICWACCTSFETSTKCYEHLREKHDGYM